MASHGSHRLAAECSNNINGPVIPGDIWAIPAWSSLGLSFLTPQLYLPRSTKLFQAFHGKQYGLRFSKWLAGQQRPSAESLPLEVWVEILSHLSCLDVLRLRQTCKRMAEISTARPVWTHQYRLLYEFVPSQLSLGQLQLTYTTSKALEQAVVGRLKRDTLWRSDNHLLQMPDVTLPRSRSTINLVGGRWLLVLHTHCDRSRDLILLYDTHNPPVCAIQLIDPSECFDNISMVKTFQVDVVQTQPHLVFHLCVTVTLKGEGCSHFGLVVYRVVQSGTAENAKLAPSKVNSFLLPIAGVYSSNAPYAFYGRYYIRSFHPMDTETDMNWHSGRLEVYDWQASNSERHLMAVVDLHEDTPVFYRLLPNNQLLIRFRKTVKLYNVSGLRSVDSSLMSSLDDSLEPFWSDEEYPAPTRGILVCVTSTPALHSPSSSIRIAYCLGARIHGVIMPSVGPGTPQHVKLSDAVLPRGSVLGIDKFAYICAPDSIVRGSFTWPDDNPGLQADTQLTPSQQIDRAAFCHTFDDLSTTVLISTGYDDYALLCALP